MFLFDVASDLVIKRNQEEVELCILIFFWGISSLFLLYVSPDVTVSPWARLKRSAALSHPPSLNFTTGHLLCSHVSSCSTAERERKGVPSIFQGVHDESVDLADTVAGQFLALDKRVQLCGQHESCKAKREFQLQALPVLIWKLITRKSIKYSCLKPLGLCREWTSAPP